MISRLTISVPAATVPVDSPCEAKPVCRITPTGPELAPTYLSRRRKGQESTSDGSKGRSLTRFADSYRTPSGCASRPDTFHPFDERHLVGFATAHAADKPGWIKAAIHIVWGCLTPLDFTGRA